MAAVSSAGASATSAGFSLSSPDFVSSATAFFSGVYSVGSRFTRVLLTGATLPAFFTMAGPGSGTVVSCLGTGSFEAVLLGSTKMPGLEQGVELSFEAVGGAAAGTDADAGF